MIKYILSLVFFMMVITPAYADKSVNCDHHPIYCQIIKNKPTIDKGFAMRLSNILYHASRKHNIPANIYTAILMQESTYRLEAKNCHRGILVDNVQKENIVKICSDFGISQIYYKTAKLFEFSINQLTSDLEYSVEAGAIVLAEFHKRYGHREINWWTRYNSSTAVKRNIYRQLVEQYI